MSLSIGIVGLPNVGKSTLFNALVKNAKAEASNYPFCTIEPNVGIVSVPDDRLEKLAEISKSQKIIPTVIEFIDIAGLVKNAHKGEGLGNQFLGHIKSCDAIAMVIRFFINENIIHVANKIDPLEDIKIIKLELILSDLAMVEKKIAGLKKETKAQNKDALARLSILNKLKQGFDQEMLALEILKNEDDIQKISDLQLITLKPILFIANVSENDAGISSEELIKEFKLESEIPDSNTLVPISAKIESELAELADDEQKEYLKSLNLEQSGLNRLINSAYETLGLLTFFTSGEKETRAWTIVKDSTAPKAAGVIHTDFERGFIAADIIKYDNFIENAGWTGCKNKGLIHTEGKKYIFQDGDITIFKFNV